jgi:hypothetical protein
MAAEYAAATATLTPYERKGFGRALIESLAAGILVIGYDKDLSNLFSLTDDSYSHMSFVSGCQPELESIERDTLTAEARKDVQRFE